MSTKTTKLRFSDLDPGTDHSAGVAVNPLYWWAICSTHANAPDPVIVVIWPEKSREFSWVEVALLELEDEDMDCSFRLINGQDRGSLAVMVGELFIDTTAEGTNLFRRGDPDIEFSGKRPAFMWEPRKSWLWGAVRVNVVKMLNTGDQQLYALARRRHSMAPRELKPLPLEGDYLPYIAFYSHFFSMPLAPTVNERLQQIRENIANFCRAWEKTHFGDGDTYVGPIRAVGKAPGRDHGRACRGDNGGALKPFVVTRGPKCAATGDTALVYVCKTCGSTAGAGETSNKDETKQLGENLTAHQGVARQARHADAATNTEDRSTSRTLSIVLAFLHCLYYGFSGCLRALLA